MRGVRESHPEEVPDFFLRETPMQLENARAYFLVKNLANWRAPIALHPWDTWEQLADRLEIRFGYHIWHPWHWQAVATKISGGVILRCMD